MNKARQVALWMVMTIGFILSPVIGIYTGQQIGMLIESNDGFGGFVGTMLSILFTLWLGCGVAFVVKKGGIDG